MVLTAKERLEAGGWRVLHGIVDSIWVTPREGADSRTALDELVEEITAEVGIRLEYESAFDWVAFCPRRDGEAGALTNYFGRYREIDHADGPTDRAEALKIRGIECRQRSTCEWVARVQRDLLDTLDEHRTPEAVCDRLRVHLCALRRGDVPPSELVTTTRASKNVEAYSRRTRTVAALERAAEQGLSTHPGQDVRYVVVDDASDSIDRVRLADEVDASTSYDVSCYRDRAIRAARSVVSPLGWDGEDVRAYLRGTRSMTLAAY